MNLILRLLFFASLVFITSTSIAQTPSYILPEYKVRYYDTTATYIQIINYFDRSYYTREIYLKKNIDAEQVQYYKIAIDTATGMGRVQEDLLDQVNLQIGRTLEIPEIELIQNKLNKVEIRTESGFLTLSLKSGSSTIHNIEGALCNAYDSSVISCELPCKKELPKGKYFLNLKTIPPFKRTIYIKPSNIKHFEVHRAVPLHIINKKSYDEYELEFAYYPYKKFKVALSGELKEGQGVTRYLQPKKVYVMKYRKKGRRRFKKKKFYIDTSMPLFNLTLD